MAALTTLRRRTLGVAFISVIVGLLVLSILVYTKFFVTTVNVSLYAGCQPPPADAGTGQTSATGTENAADVTSGMSAADAAGEASLPMCTTQTLQDDTAGHELDIPADVKLRGILVGSVTNITLADNRAVIHLHLNPGDAKLIPANVSAEIVPKTLFGEKYVDLVIPSNPSSVDIAHGDHRILQSSTSIEAEQVFNDLVPLLQTLHPAQLKITLSNLAMALQGRGNELGGNLAQTDTYLQGINPDLPNIETDITGLEDLANNVNDATPDLLALARQFSKTSNTLVAKGDTLAQFLTGTESFANTADQILVQNETNIVQLADTGEPILRLLAEYAPEYGCVLTGLTDQAQVLGQAFSPHGADKQYALHINLTVPSDAMRHAYTTADTPKNTAQNVETAFPQQFKALDGPCFGLPAVRTSPINGYLPINGTPTPTQDPEAGSPTSASSATAANASAISSSPSALARVLVAPELGVTSSQVPDLDTVLLAPALEGKDVSVSYLPTSGSGS